MPESEASIRAQMDAVRAQADGIREQLRELESLEHSLYTAFLALRHYNGAVADTATAKQGGTIPVAKVAPPDPLMLIDAAMANAPGPLRLAEIRTAIAPLFPKLAKGQALRRLLNAHPERGWRVSGMGRGAKWRRVDMSEPETK